LSYLAETEFLFSLRPKDRWSKLSRKILQKASQNKIRIGLLESATLEMRTVLYSQGMTPRGVYRSLVLIKRKLIRYEITEEATSIDDYILADRLREEFKELTYFDSIHAAAALRRNQTLLTNDAVYARCEVKTIPFRELAESTRP
jgi:predicted nucleic acid-binding protein